VAQTESATVPRTWFITGCSAGIGRALAQEVLARGQRAVITARKIESIASLGKEFADRALTLPLDVTAPAAVKEAVAQALARMGRIDVLVNNAGYGVVGAVEEVSEAEVRAQFETNVIGLLSVTKAVLPHMRERRRGHILNVSSQTGLFAPAGFGLYSASKFAVEGLSEAMAAELAPLGIRVTLIEPGPFRTNFRGGIVFAKESLLDYAQSVGPARRAMSEPGGKQPGDPRLAAKVMADLVDSPHPPLRLPLGQIAIGNIRKHLAAVEQEIAQWEKIGAATSFQE